MSKVLSKILIMSLLLITSVIFIKPVHARSFKDGWTTASVNVRKSPSTEFDILETYPLNTKVSYVDYNDDWVKIKYGKGIAYMCKDYISDREREHTDFSVPSNSGFKSYMPYTAITATNSPQYILQHTEAYTGNYGIRQVNGRYCVAVGSYFTSKIGTLFDLVLENGTIIPCVLADQKADQDTDWQNIATSHNGCVSEFIVDSGYLSRKAKLHGDVSYCREDWNSPVKTVRVYE